MKQFVFGLGIFCVVFLQSIEFVIIPDYEPFVETLFLKGEVLDFRGASLWNKVKYLLNHQGYGVSASTLRDVLSRKDMKDVQVVIWNVPQDISKIRLGKIDPKCLNLIVFEPPSVSPKLHTTEYYSLFSKVFTWEDDKIDGGKFLKYCYPVCYKMISDIVPFSERKLCTVMAANKNSKFSGEIYSERRRAIEYFNKILLKNENDSSSLNNLGICLLEIGKYKDSINKFDKALEKEPDFTISIYNKALALE